MVLELAILLLSNSSWRRLHSSRTNAWVYLFGRGGSVDAPSRMQVLPWGTPLRGDRSGNDINYSMFRSYKRSAREPRVPTFAVGTHRCKATP